MHPLTSPLNKRILSHFPASKDGNLSVSVIHPLSNTDCLFGFSLYGRFCQASSAMCGTMGAIITLRGRKRGRRGKRVGREGRGGRERESGGTEGDRGRERDREREYITTLYYTAQHRTAHHTALYSTLQHAPHHTAQHSRWIADR